MTENALDYIFGIALAVISWFLRKLDESHKELKANDSAICRKVAEIELVSAREYPTRAELKGYFDKLEQKLHDFDQKLERLSDRLIK
jgi:hypothetical protein